jgi:hypothetical protein
VISGCVFVRQTSVKVPGSIIKMRVSAANAYNFMTGGKVCGRPSKNRFFSERVFPFLHLLIFDLLTFPCCSQDHDLSLWDVHNCKVPLFRAKNVRNDELDLQVPIHVTDTAFLSAEHNNTLASATALGLVRPCFGQFSFLLFSFSYICIFKAYFGT